VFEWQLDEVTCGLDCGVLSEDIGVSQLPQWAAESPSPHQFLRPRKALMILGPTAYSNVRKVLAHSCARLPDRTVPLGSWPRFRSMSKNASARRSAGEDCVLSPRPTLAEDRCGIHQDALMYSAILDPGHHGCSTALAPETSDYRTGTDSPGLSSLVCLHRPPISST
jgi:hypothetical protein